MIRSMIRTNSRFEKEELLLLLFLEVIKEVKDVYLIKEVIRLSSMVVKFTRKKGL